MSFTPEIHRKVAWALASFFPIFTFTAAFLRTIPVPSILTQEITSIDSLPDELKLQLLHNNTQTLDPDDIDNLPSHLFLQMVPHSFHIPPLLVLISLVSLIYAYLSAKVAGDSNGMFLQCTTVDLKTIAEDIHLLFLDTTFWFFFALSHFTIYLVVLKTTTLGSASSFVITTLFTTWALTNRIIIQHPPAVITAVAMLMSALILFCYEASYRERDIWLTSTLLAIADVVLTVSATMDHSLTPEVLANSRITYTLAANAILLFTIYYLAI